MSQTPAPTVIGDGSEPVGTVIGAYKLLDQIGEGGMGVVYLADQQAPVRRRVALKIIKPGMDTREVIARFEAERQALALMDHPNIAKVLDAGATASGRPYFVMELVHGVPVTEYCDQNNLSIPERLGLFVHICHAVQHAHQKGVIHRDIKPSNILVTLHDGAPVPKVIDFGVAKAINQQLTDKTLFTHFSQMVGTPMYMSPEQAELSALDVDTRSDIYSLGVLMYELLTGTTPFDSNRLKKAALDEVRRIIREEEPPKPSTRLSSLGDTRTAVASHRRVDPGRLDQIVRGDLDWIVMKALEKDRSRRYETANLLARDVERYLTDQPVEACPPSAAYRLRKFTRRNRVAVLTLLAVLASLGVGTVVATWQAIEATRAKREALAAAAAEKQAKLAAESATAAEKTAKETAQAKQAESRAVLDFVQNKIFAAARPKGVDGGLGRTVPLKDALEAALPAVNQSFATQPLIEAQVRTTLGKSFGFLGEPKTAAEQYERAYAIYTKELGPNHHDTLVSMSNLANSYSSLSKYDEAIELRKRAVDLWKATAGPSSPDALIAMNNLANSYYQLGKYQEALKLHEQTLALRRATLPPDHPNVVSSINNVAGTYAAFGRFNEAIPLFEEGLRLRERSLGKDHPDTLESKNNLAECYFFLGRYAESLDINKETLAVRKEKLGPTHPDTLLSMNNIARCYSELGRNEEAAKLQEEAWTLRRQKLGRDHFDTLESLHNLACTRFKLGQRAEALKLYDEGLALRQKKFGANHPVTIDCIFEMSYLRLRDAQKSGDAKGCRQIAQLCEDQKPTSPERRYDVACYWAVTAAALRKEKGATSQAEAQANADHAFECLKQALAAGYKDAAKLKQDKDLDVLRDRADFRQLLAGLTNGPDGQKK